jgi:hypothetical protein
LRGNRFAHDDELGSQFAEPRRDMRSRGFFLIGLFLAATTATAQEWKRFFDAAAFGTYVTETGPKKPEKHAFSTNWLIIGVERELGHRGAILGRAKLSAEPLTIPAKGYPQLLQYVSPAAGGPLVDHHRAHDLVEEAAVAVEWRPLQLYVAPVGEPPLGAEPFAQRTSSIDFAEAPFSYDVQESFHVATRVVAVGFTSRIADVEYGVFHDAHTTGRHSRIDDGKIDSWSTRITFAPQGRLSGQISIGRLGDAKQEVSSASISYKGTSAATTAIWAQRDKFNAYSLESTLHAGRSTLMARLETVDRPAGIFTDQKRRMGHATVGYIFEILRRPNHRAGVGLNIDYHTGLQALESRYGHKPQGIYMFVRWRTEGISRPTSP